MTLRPAGPEVMERIWPEPTLPAWPASSARIGTVTLNRPVMGLKKLASRSMGMLASTVVWNRTAPLATTVPAGMRMLLVGRIVVKNFGAVRPIGTEVIPGEHDFPTGAIILNSKTEIRKAYEVGSGAVKIRGEWKLEDLPRGKQQIIITSIPYGVNKSKQHLFKIVRIEIVDIGIGKPFGPINALVIDDDNTSTIPPKKITVTEYNE